MGLYILLLPLLSSIICGFLNHILSYRLTSIIACSSIALSALLSVIVFICMVNNQNILTINIIEWFTIMDITVSFSIYIDSLTSIMFVVVTLVSAVVHIYSTGYMCKDPGFVRFMAYLSLFTFFMLLLVSSDNFMQLFVGWEGVGLCSYLLIGFWYKKASACSAAIKAFVVNRIGDLAFILGIVLIIVFYGAVNFTEVFTLAKTLDATQMSHGLNGIDVICILLFIGAMGKSAQIGLHVWLADAMEGPTPVSALIHAATMVTAGVFLVARCSFLFELSPIALNIMAITGAITCFIAGTIAVSQSDIKKIIAYSTSSQLGYMFLACGVSAYRAAIFHLVTHAFFKSMLFLAAGNVIHASHEQDIRKLGGLRRKLPWTYLLFWIGSLAMMGIYPFAGYYSKDMILESVAFSGRYYLFYTGIAAAFFTACYSMKLLLLTFHGSSRLPVDILNNLHESIYKMVLPLLLLAFGALCLGYFGEYYLHIGNNEGYLAFSIVKYHNYIHNLEKYIELLPIIVSVLAIVLSVIIFNNNIWQKIGRSLGWVGKFVENKYYFDEIYNILFVRLLYILSKCSALYDGVVIDRFGPGSAVYFVKKCTKVTRLLQSGYIFNYALFMLLGLLFGMSWFLVTYINRIV